MPGQSKGKAFGREMVRAMSEPWDGKVLTGKVEADGENQGKNLATSSTPARADSVPIKGVAIKGDPDNTGTVWVIELGEDGNPGAGDEGYPLAAGDAISLATDNLNKVNVFIPTSGDKVRYCAIAASNNVEP